MTALFNGLFADLDVPAFLVGVGDESPTLSASAYKDNKAFLVSGADQSGRSVTVQAIAKVSVWQADAANGFPVQVKCGTGTVTLAPGQVKVIATDGTANGIAGLELSDGSTAWQEILPAASPFQATAGDHLDINTSTAVVTVTLPPDPAKYHEVWFRNSASSFASFALTVARNGETIEGEAADFTASTDGADFSLWFNGTTWKVSIYA